jgi:hypothetical protein
LAISFVIACLWRIDRATVAALLVAHMQGLGFGALRAPSYLRQRIAVEYINRKALRPLVLPCFRISYIPHSVASVW